MRSVVVAVCILVGCGKDETEPVGVDPVECTASETPRGPDTVYLRFEGATLTSVPDGDDDAPSFTSSLIDGTTQFPPFLAADPDRQSIIDALVSDMEEVLAPFAVTITTSAPAGDHMMVVFAGLTDESLLGLVRRDCGDAVRNDVAILFEGVADPARGRYGMANETIFVLTRSVGLAKSSGPGHPCSCDPSGMCENDELCTPTVDAEVSFSECPGAGDVQDEVAALGAVFGCDE